VILNKDKRNKIISELLIKTISNDLIWDRYIHHESELFVTRLPITKKKSVRVQLTKRDISRGRINFYMEFSYKGVNILSLYYQNYDELFKLFSVVKYKQYLEKSFGIDKFLKKIITDDKIDWKEIKIYDKIIGYNHTILGKPQELNHELIVIIYIDRLTITYDGGYIIGKMIDNKYFREIQKIKENV
jgi:hypothetical protein